MALRTGEVYHGEAVCRRLSPHRDLAAHGAGTFRARRPARRSVGPFTRSGPGVLVRLWRVPALGLRAFLARRPPSMAEHLLPAPPAPRACDAGEAVSHGLLPEALGPARRRRLAGSMRVQSLRAGARRASRPGSASRSPTTRCCSAPPSGGAVCRGRARYRRPWAAARNGREIEPLLLDRRLRIDPEPAAGRREVERGDAPEAHVPRAERLERRAHHER